MPFEEFSLHKIAELVTQLEKTGSKKARVEVTPLDDSHHVPCMKEMTAVMVQEIEDTGENPQILAMYQYCPVCQTAVRVL